MKHKVADLEGWLLDLAVAIADGRDWTINRSPHADGGVIWITVVDAEMADQPHVPFAPSRSWCDGGPIIERERITIAAVGRLHLEWFAEVVTSGLDSSVEVGYEKNSSDGPTPLVAAMRAYVASKLGDEIELP